MEATTHLLRSVKPTTDGGFILAGHTLSNDGDVSGNHGDEDYWVVKLDGLGALQWQVALGGSDEDKASGVVQTTDGGYLICGNTKSDDGDVTGFHGGDDVWVVKLSAAGSLLWQKTFGGATATGPRTCTSRLMGAVSWLGAPTPSMAMSLAAMVGSMRGWSSSMPVARCNGRSPWAVVAQMQVPPWTLQAMEDLSQWVRPTRPMAMWSGFWA